MTIQDALTKLQADVQAETNATAGMTQVLNTVSAELKAALALGDPNQIITQVQAISSTLETDTASIVAATLANTPAAPTTPPATTPATTP